MSTCPAPIHVVGVRLERPRPDLVKAPLRGPSAVGPLPTEEPLDEGIRPPIGQSQLRQEPEGVPLLRGASTGPAPHHGHSFVPIGLGLRARHEFAEIIGLEPTFENPIPDRKEGLVPAGIAEIREGGEDPVDSLPLVVHLSGGPRSTEFVSAGEEGPYPRGGADLFLQFADRLRIAVFAEDVDVSLPPSRGFFRPQEAIDHGPRIEGSRSAARLSPPSISSHRHREGLDARLKCVLMGRRGRQAERSSVVEPDSRAKAGGSWLNMLTIPSPSFSEKIHYMVM